MKDYIVRATAANAQIRAFAASTTELVEEAAYTLEEITRIVEESGLQFVTAYEAFTKEQPSKSSERIYVIAREQGKVPVKKAE